MTAVLALVASSLFAAEPLDPSKLPPPADVKIDFLRDIEPILQNSCLKCHSGEKPKSNFRLNTREAALRGGTHGVDIVPGQSAKSPLVYAIAGAIEDMEMPPPSRGTPLTLQQISLLRAWIDQGVAWAGTTNEITSEIAVSPTVGWTTVSGDHRKFRELYWQHEGWNGGLERFEITEKPGPDSQITASGHVLRDDYKLTLSAEKNGLGFTRFGWTQFRKYYDGTGGYDPLLNPSAYSLNRDLNLDVGRAWADFGLTLPDLPTIVLGYEYQYRDGTEATLQWGAVNSSDPRLIYPGFKQISERVHILKLDVDYEIAGVELSDSFRGEWYRLATGQLDENLTTNGAPAMAFTRIDERQNYFQGANTFHLEKQFTDWLFGAGGYLYSKLNADGSTTMEQINVGALDPTWPPSLYYAWNASSLQLERESHVFSLSGLAGPWEGLSLSVGTQNEWTRQTGFGVAAPELISTLFLPPPTFALPLSSQTGLSTLDHRVFSQNVGLRFTRLPFTTLYADARFQQETYGEFEQENGGVFPQLMYRTDAASHLYDVRAGFNTSPWRRLSLSGQFRRSDNETDYDNLFKQVAIPNEGYPSFIRLRDLLANEAQTKLAFQWNAWFKTSLSYDWLQRHYRNATDPVSDFSSGFPGIAGGISTGAPLLAGTYDAHVASLNATLVPSPKLTLSATFSFQNARTATEADGNPAVAPYEGNLYTALATASYRLGSRTTLVASYAFSTADFSQQNLIAGLPLGLTYHQHTLQAGLKRQLSASSTMGLQYRFFYYDEPSRGGTDNFTAHGIYATLACRLP